MRMPKERLTDFDRGMVMAEEFLKKTDNVASSSKLYMNDIRELLEGLHSERDIVEATLEVAKDGGIDGAHHKQWVIDQMVRVLAGDDYEQWVTDFEAGEDGPNTYEWDTGIAP